MITLCFVWICTEIHPQRPLVSNTRWCGGTMCSSDWGTGVYVIDPKKRSGSEIWLSIGSGFSYFGAFYAGQDYLLVASGDSRLRLSPNGKVLWGTRDLGLDGVVVKS